jgi:hypothetical protein
LAWKRAALEMRSLIPAPPWFLRRDSCVRLVKYSSTSPTVKCAVAVDAASSRSSRPRHTAAAVDDLRIITGVVVVVVVVIP